jgi:thioredoxin
MLELGQTPPQTPADAGDLIKDVSEMTFMTDVIEASQTVPVIVDFWAPWCGPCKMIAPLLDQVADEYDGRVKICKINVDENPEAAAKFNVRGIPTILAFKNGSIEATKVGALSKSQLTEFIDALL